MASDRAVGLGVIALLVIGAAAGRASVEPEYIKDTETIYKTEVKEVRVPGPREPYVPKSCLDAVGISIQYAEAASVVTDQVPPILDAIAQARQGIAAGDGQPSVLAENKLRTIDGKTVNLNIKALELEGQYETAIAACQEETSE